MALRYGHIGQNAQRQAMALLDRPAEHTMPGPQDATAESRSGSAVH